MLRGFDAEGFTLRRKFYIMMNRTAFGIVWDVTILLLSLMAVCMFVLGTYRTGEAQDPYLLIVELPLAIFFTIDYVFNWFLASEML
jgi:hypothetical protein